MIYQEKNEFGVITVDDAFLNQLIKESLKAYEGKAWLANYKGKSSNFAIKLGNIDSLAEKKVKTTEQGLYIKLYLMVKFGVSIKEVCGHIFDTLSAAIEEDLELTVDDFVVEITGVWAKNGIGKRSMIVSYKNKVEEEH